MAVRGKESHLTVEFDRKRCLHSRVRWAECSLCIQSCPGQAIVKTEESSLLQYLENKCLNCGQCLSVCPLEAFTSSRFTESFLLDRLRGDSLLFLRCCRANDAINISARSQQECDLDVCFAALSPGFLFEIARKRECVFDTSHCSSCPLYEKERETIETNFRFARSLLLSWGLEGSLRETDNILFLEGTKPLLEEQEFPVKQIPSRKSYSDLRARFYGSQSIKKELTSPSLFKTLERRSPSWRLRLAQQWKRLESTENSPKELVCPFIKVDSSSCRACGTCMQFCPTGALVHTVKDNIFSVSFLPGLCVDCGLCVASCSNHAVHQDARATNSPFSRTEILSKPVRYCTQCKAPFINGEHEMLCVWCSFEPRFQELIDYSKEQMRFDEVEKRDSGEK